MPLFLFRRVAYYLVVVVAAIVAHTEIPAAVLGQGFGDLLRRNSEAYVLMLMPLYWDLFVPCAEPRFGGRCAEDDTPSISRHLIWFGIVAAAALVTQPQMRYPADDGLPNWLVTLGEAFLAILVITIYVAWSRGFFSKAHPSGLPVVSVGARAVYYVAVVLVAIMGEQSWLSGWGADYIRLNTEATAAMILIPAYFDVVAASDRRVVRIGWYGGLLALPVLVQIGLDADVVGQSLIAWLETVTEAVLATVVVSAYFDWVRGTWSHRRLSAAELG